MRRLLSLKRCLFAALVGFPVMVSAQQTATVTGRVLEKSGAAGVPGARVSVVGTDVVGMTSETGAFTLRGVPTGSQTIRAIRIGFVEGKQTVQVTAGSNTVNFSLDA